MRPRLLRYMLLVFALVLASAPCLPAIAQWSSPLADQISPVALPTGAQNAAAPSSPVRLIFIHHSTGTNWLEDNWGHLGLALRDNNYYVSDTNYGWGPDDIGSRTDLGHWWQWFRDASHSPAYLTALYAETGQNAGYSRLGVSPGGENEIILFKSCFPNSNLNSPIDPPTTGSNPMNGKSAGDASYTVANAKGLYLDLLTYFATRPDKLFVAITAPPLAAGATNASLAANARVFNNWLVDANGWLRDYPHPNVAVFDYYNVLTGPNNHHRYNSSTGLVEHLSSANNVSYYPSSASDSHPNAAGDQKASAEFVPLLNVYYQRWQVAFVPTSWVYLPAALQ